MIRMSDSRLRRVAVTLPPSSWGGGRERACAHLMISAIRMLGIEVFEFDYEVFFSKNAQRIAEHIAQLRAFTPQVAVATPNAGYGVLARDPISKKNIFTEVLEVPLVLTWDGVCQFATQLVSLPAHPNDSRSGTDQALRAELRHPLLFHVAYDSGQIAALDALDIVPAARVLRTMPPIYQQFIAVGASAPQTERYDDEVAFVGNLFLKRANKSPLRSQNATWDLVCRAVRNRPLTEPIWDSLQSQLSQLSVQDLTSERLTPSDSFFWFVANEAISHVGCSHDRVSMLKSLRCNASFYGGFCDPDEHEFVAREIKCNFRGVVDMGAELAHVNARTKITVDIVNRVSHRGMTAKPLSCFAAGGFSLFDYRADFAELLGSSAEPVMFRDFDEMNRKVDYYLTFEHERRELAAHMRRVLVENFSLKEMYRRILNAVVDSYAV